MDKFTFDKLHEECGVFGIFDKNDLDVVASTYSALYALQHRGQESCGIAINEDGVISCYKDLGLVNDVFNKDVLARLPKNGKMAIGHVRYATSGSLSRHNAQPLVVKHIKGAMALAHNGNLTNAGELRRELELNGAIFHTSSDTEVISYIVTRERLNAPSIEAAVASTMKTIKGAYSLLIMSPSKLIAARDPHGFRPLCIGKLDDSYIFASESCALDACGAAFIRDVEPGEIVVCTKDGLTSNKEMCGGETSMCVFEYVYFARPDSVIENSSVHIARQRAGAFLALESPVQADVVIGVPDSGLDAALGYARQSGIPYGVGFIKNKYIGRTFIQGTQKQRESSVRIKLNPIASTVKGKRVILIDDSIVRGTTSARIVKLLREAGASEVHFRVSCPPFIYPCYFGTDIDSRKNLIAVNRTNEEIAKIIGADTLGYLSVENVVKLAENAKCGFCTGCFTGKYPVEVPNKKEADIFSRPLSESPKFNKK